MDAGGRGNAVWGPETGLGTGIWRCGHRGLVGLRIAGWDVTAHETAHGEGVGGPVDHVVSSPAKWLAPTRFAGARSRPRSA